MRSRLAMRKIFAAAVREYRTTALTRAFLFGAVVFPVLIWGGMIAVTATGVFDTNKPPLSGTIGVMDTTAGRSVEPLIAAQFDRTKMVEEMRQRAEELERRISENPVAKKLAESHPEEFEQGKSIVTEAMAGSVPDVKVESVPADADLERVRKRIGGDDLLALIVVGENSMALPPRPAPAASAGSESGEGDASSEPAAPDEAGAPPDEDPGAAPGVFTFLHAKNLDTDYVQDIQRAVVTAIQNERFHRASIDPLTVQTIQTSPPKSVTRSIDESGEEQVSSQGFTEMLPFIFMMLVFISTMTGGQYLLMGTLEEKGTRVMEVLLSAISPLQLLIGKLLGQGLVGLTILAIYAGLGVAISDRFGYLALIPVDKLPLLLVFFIMAYAFLGSMMVSVGAAVTEIREAQSLYAPITITIMLPFILLVPILKNPNSPVAIVFSFFPPTVPFVMVMRMSQTAHPVPTWQIALSIAIGFAGVIVAVWFAAKIFRVGVLMYGKPPSLLTLLKWVRYA